MKGISGFINVALLTQCELCERSTATRRLRILFIFSFQEAWGWTRSFRWELWSPAVALKYFHRLCSVPWPHVLKYRLGAPVSQLLDDVPVSVDGKQRLVFSTFGCLHTRDCSDGADDVEKCTRCHYHGVKRRPIWLETKWEIQQNGFWKAQLDPPFWNSHFSTDAYTYVCCRSSQLLVISICSSMSLLGITLLKSPDF